jgi:hypothetical protein
MALNTVLATETIEALNAVKALKALKETRADTEPDAQSSWIHALLSLRVPRRWLSFLIPGQFQML